MSETAISDLMRRAEALESAVEVLEAKMAAVIQAGRPMQANIQRVPHSETRSAVLGIALRQLVEAMDYSDFWVGAADDEKVRSALKHARNVLAQ